ncbi:MAG: hypothetical protein ACRDPE_07565 [Solirubrobacterales bacterium]
MNTITDETEGKKRPEELDLKIQATNGDTWDTEKFDDKEKVEHVIKRSVKHFIDGGFPPRRHTGRRLPHHLVFGTRRTDGRDTGGGPATAFRNVRPRFERVSVRELPIAARGRARAIIKVFLRNRCNRTKVSLPLPMGLYGKTIALRTRRRALQRPSSPAHERTGLSSVIRCPQAQSRSANAAAEKVSA